MEIVLSETYSFEQLEKALFEQEDRNVYLKVFNTEVKQFGIMHVLYCHFADQWLEGNGIIFYDDGEVHSANSYDEFKVVAILQI